MVHCTDMTSKLKKGQVKPRCHLLWSSGKWCYMILCQFLTKEWTLSNNITHFQFWTAFVTASHIGVDKLVVGYARIGKLDGLGRADWGNKSSSCLERCLRFTAKQGDLWGVSTGARHKGTSRFLWGRRLPRNKTSFTSNDQLHLSSHNTKALACEYM